MHVQALGRGDVLELDSAGAWVSSFGWPLLLPRFARASHAAVARDLARGAQGCGAAECHARGARVAFGQTVVRTSRPESSKVGGLVLDPHVFFGVQAQESKVILGKAQHHKL